MRKFEISADSTCDLYFDEIKKYEIDVAPLDFVLTKGDEVIEQKDNFKTKEEYLEFYNKLKNGYLAKTSILNLQAHIDLFTSMAERGVKKALHICQSYGLSPTLDNANKAIEIVRIGDAYYAIAMGKDEINLICKLDENELKINEPEPIVKVDSFKELFEKVKKKQ